jgi:hypothetical protein
MWWCVCDVVVVVCACNFSLMIAAGESALTFRLKADWLTNPFCLLASQMLM